MSSDRSNGGEASDEAGGKAAANRARRRQLEQVSRQLSYVLRHEPTAAGITLDAAGWADVDQLLGGLAHTGLGVTRDELAEVVATSDKQRFSFDGSGLRIRANQGHSQPVDLGLAPQPPPDVLFHGTVGSALSGIFAEGLTRQQRHHVHLSADRLTAARVGSRRGSPVVLEVDAAAMAGDGHLFYRTDNGVWLTERVPYPYLTVVDNGCRQASVG